MFFNEKRDLLGTLSFRHQLVPAPVPELKSKKASTRNENENED
jgi:hypothetical protein